VIDHLTARRTLATSVDFPIERAEAEDLEAHLRSCAACRSFDASIRADAAVMRDLDFGPVPVAVRAGVAIAAERRGGGAGRWFALVAVGAVLIAALGGGVLGVGGERTSLGSGRNAIHWQTDVVVLTARDFWIEANGQRFTAEVPEISVISDPGNAAYRTLEATWFEHGVEMRLNLYFAGDGATSWVREIRVYDGTPDPKWLTWQGTWFKTPNGVVSVGDLDLSTDGGAIHVGGLELRSMPFDAVNEPPGGGAPVPAPAFNLFDPGGALYCSGILQLPPAEAERTLLALGYRLSWRFVIDDGGYWDPRREAPDGVIQKPIGFGTDGELIIPVIRFGDKGAEPVPYPDDCPTPGRPSAVPSPDPPTPAPSPSP
jgi:hypothetical protein